MSFYLIQNIYEVTSLSSRIVLLVQYIFTLYKIPDTYTELMN